MLWACQVEFEAIVPPDETCHEKIRGRYQCMAREFRAHMYCDAKDIDFRNVWYILDLCDSWNIKGGWGQDLSATLRSAVRG